MPDKNETKEIAILDQSGKAITITTQMVKDQICPAATDAEIALFLNIARSFNLNPFKREIHLIKYAGSPASFIVGYEVYLKRAEHTDKLDGWKITVDNIEKPTQATIIIYRKDKKYPIEWTVYRREVAFAKGKEGIYERKMHKEQPLFQLRKCVIAQGFRLAFPEDLGGMPYIPEELTGGTSEELTKEEIEHQNITAEPAKDDSTVEPSPAPSTDLSTLTFEEQYKQLCAKMQKMVYDKKLRASQWSRIFSEIERGYETAEQKIAALQKYHDEILAELKKAK